MGLNSIYGCDSSFGMLVGINDGWMNKWGINLGKRAKIKN